MDKNTVTGLIVIALIFVGWYFLMTPSEEEIIRARYLQDSIARVEARREALIEQERTATLQARQEQVTNTAGTIFQQDSLEAEEFVLENSKVRMHVNTRGGRITLVELKEYRTHDSLPLVLWREGKSSLGLSFYANNVLVNTEKLIFHPGDSPRRLDAAAASQSLSLRAYAGEEKYLEFRYTLDPDSYQVTFLITTHRLDDLIASQTNFLELNWGLNMPQLEKSKDFENRYTGVYYRFSEDDVENLSTSGNDRAEPPTKVKWIAFKQQFFSSILLSENAFSNVAVSSDMATDPGYLKDVHAVAFLPYVGGEQESYTLRFFFGPNSFPVLQEYGDALDFPDLVDLGWKWLAWINRYIVIPIFHFLERNVTLNYGLIIFLLTLIIKMFLFPLTYKSYLSQAKMRVLKPQVDEIHKKIPADKAVERQQATMKLYKQAGVNPMGGCLPMLLQFPFLVALFYFFPGAIELRQQGFLWATDLASYDSILDLPFRIPGYGSHVSLFCLLMTVTNIIYTVMSQRNQPMNDQMKSMRVVMYLMPVIFLFIFNDYSSGLSYYYFISLLITIIQTWAIRRFVDDGKLLKQIELAKAKPVKRSKFQERLEAIQKEQERQRKARLKK
ncbi:MAG: membrane protein insertase YidC [Odoribacteraceae bacterium]|jgi:YidC/Oxa1 family membrane protein insertase|nr:membrane protein insertase YidC [Odoribacteraceae bacterium]